MNGQPDALALLEVLEGAWWGGHACPAPAPPAPQQKRQISWWPFGGSQPAAPPPAAQRSQNGAKPRVSRARSLPNLEAAAKSRPPRPGAGAKPQSTAGARAEVATPVQLASEVPAAAATTAMAAEGAAAVKKLGGRQAKADGVIPRTTSKPSLSKQLSYQERRRLWRERLEHAKAKAERRAATSTAITAATEGGSLGGGPQPGASGRKFASRHIAIPASKLGAGGGCQSTPAGSPRRTLPLHGEQPGGEAGASGKSGSSPPPEFLDVPPIWQGFQTAETPADFNACGKEQLRRFLMQAGRALPPTDAGVADLAAAARECRGAWEVERIMVACQWPQEVLRVPRSADPATLKAAYRRVSFLVHPDKNTAVGASDAFSIVADAYWLLTLGKAAATIPAFMRQNHPTRLSQQHQDPAAAGAAGPSAAKSDQSHEPHQAEQQQSAPNQPDPSTVFASEGSTHGSASGSLPGEDRLSRTSSASFVDYYFAHTQRTSSAEEEDPAACGGDAGPLSSHHVCGSDRHDHWNPQGRLSSNEELHPRPPSFGAPGSPERLPSRRNLTSGVAEWASAAEDWPQAGMAQTLGASSSASPGGQTPRASRSVSSGGSPHGGRLGLEGPSSGHMNGAPPHEQPSPQSSGPAGVATGSDSKASTPERPSEPIPSHSRNSSAHSFAGEPAAGAAGSAPAGQDAGTAASGPGGAGAAAGATSSRAGAPLEKPPLTAATKIIVTIKYKTVGLGRK